MERFDSRATTGGFTLLEIVIVLAIVAVLAALGTKVSRDDVVRARDGQFIGLAKDFDP